MTNKYLTGAYPAGYTLSSTYSGLFIERVGKVGGSGVTTTASATILNFGHVEAGTSSSGVTLLDGGSITNGSAKHTAALIEGGRGILVEASAEVTNFGSIVGTSGGPTAGVEMFQAGTVTNGSVKDTTALIRGSDGVTIYGGPSMVTNFGTIDANYSIGVIASGTVANGSAADTAALMTGYTGVYASGVSTIANHGEIQGWGKNGAGVELNAGGALTNGSAADPAASILGHLDGVLARGAAATIVNFGVIRGTTGPGVTLVSGGSVTNGSIKDTTAQIAGKEGVVTSGVATVTNFGAISGTSGGAAVQFNSASDVLVVEAHSAFVGAVRGGGGTLDLASGDGTLAALAGGNVTVSGSMATTTFTNFGTLEIAPAARFTLTTAGEIGPGGIFAMTNDGLFAVTGNLIVTGAITGTGVLSIRGGTLEIDAGASLAATRLAVWDGAVATINTNFTYAGGFRVAPDSTLTLGTSDRLTLTGSAGLAGTVDGAGAVNVFNGTVGDLMVGGNVRLTDAGAVDQTGNITIGDGSSKAARLVIASGATYTIKNNAGIARGASPQSQIVNDGALVKPRGGNESVIGVRVVDAGSITDEGGRLDFTQNLTGSGTMTVQSGGTLEADAAAASTLSMTFDGTEGILALASPRRFAATINGFAATDIIDLVDKRATSAVLGAGDTLVITNGANAVATLQLAGDYTGDTFTVGSDGHQGSTITLNSPPGPAAPHPAASHAFVAAMAGLGASAGSPIHADSHGRLGPSPMLARPGAAMA